MLMFSFFELLTLKLDLYALLRVEKQSEKDTTALFMLFAFPIIHLFFATTTVALRFVSQLKFLFSN